MSMLKRISPNDGLNLDLNIASHGLDISSKLDPAHLPTTSDGGSGASSAIHFETICSVCEFANVGSRKCSVCNNFCHEKPPCSQILKVGADAIEIICLLCERSKQTTTSTEYYNRNQNPNPKRYKNSPERNLMIGSRPPVVPGLHGGVPGLHGGGVDGCASPSFPIATDAKPIQSCKPFAYKSRARPALFKFNVDGHSEWAQ
jgi:hypothetical protein